MAIKVVTQFPFVINSNDTYVIGDASQAFASTYPLHFVAAGSFDGDVTVGARSRTIASTASAPAFLAIPYLPQNVAGTAEASYPTYSAATIGDSGLVQIPASGNQIALTCANWTTGTLTVYGVPLAGAAC